MQAFRGWDRCPTVEKGPSTLSWQRHVQPRCPDSLLLHCALLLTYFDASYETMSNIKCVGTYDMRKHWPGYHGALGVFSTKNSFVRMLSKQNSLRGVVLHRISEDRWTTFRIGCEMSAYSSWWRVRAAIVKDDHEGTYMELSALVRLSLPYTVHICTPQLLPHMYDHKLPPPTTTTQYNSLYKLTYLHPCT